jgi:hypothetical protein
MSMCIGSTAASAASTSWQNRRQNFGSLVSSIKSGDLAAAQQAFAALSGQSASDSTSNTSATSASSSTGNDTPQQNGLAAVGQALANGDIKGAQQALANMFAQRAGGHHHHHGGNADTAAASTGTTTTPAVSPGSTISILA